MRLLGSKFLAFQKGTKTKKMQRKFSFSGYKLQRHPWIYIYIYNLTVLKVCHSLRIARYFLLYFRQLDCADLRTVRRPWQNQGLPRTTWILSRLCGLCLRLGHNSQATSSGSCRWTTFYDIHASKDFNSWTGGVDRQRGKTNPFSFCFPVAYTKGSN